MKNKNLFMILTSVGIAGLSYADITNSSIYCASTDGSVQITATWGDDGSVEGSFLKAIVNQKVTITDSASLAKDTPFTATDLGGGGDLSLVGFDVGFDSKLSFSAFHHDTVVSFVSDAMTLGTSPADNSKWNGKYVYDFTDPRLHRIHTVKDVLCHNTSNMADPDSKTRKTLFLEKLKKIETK